MARLRAVHTAPNEKLNALLVSRETSPIATGMRLCELLKRPQLSYASLAPFDPERPDLPAQVCEQVEITIKYEGYIKKQLEQVEQMRRLEGKAASRRSGLSIDRRAAAGSRREIDAPAAIEHRAGIAYQRRQSGGCVCAVDLAQSAPCIHTEGRGGNK